MVLKDNERFSLWSLEVIGWMGILLGERWSSESHSISLFSVIIGVEVGSVVRDTNSKSFNSSNRVQSEEDFRL